MGGRIKLTAKQGKNEQTGESGKKTGLLQTIFRYADFKDMMLMALGSLGCFADGSSTPLIMLVLSVIMNKYAVHASFTLHDISKDSLHMIGLAIFAGLGGFIEGLSWARTSERQTSRLRRKYLSAVLRQDASFHDKPNGAATAYQIVSSISADTLAIQSVLSEKIPNFLVNIATFVTAEGVAFYLSRKLAIVVIPTLSLLLIPGIVYGKLQAELARNIQEAYGVAGRIAEQAFSSIRTVFAYGGESQMERSFSAALERTMELGIKQGLLKGIVIGSVGIAFTIWSFQAWYGSILVTKKGAKGGNVFTAGVCIVIGGLALGGSLINIKFFTEAATSASLISEIIERVPTIDSQDQRGKTIEDVRGELEFKDIDFAYPSRPGTMVLQNFSLRVIASQTVGLVGGSGSGKSTLISLLERFYDPIKGDILLDGIDTRTLQLNWLRSQIGLVSQEPVLFATSIKHNILFGKEGAAMDEVINAAKAANAHNFISQLPDGYDTKVGQLGIQMSGGQKQRIAIARALLKEPKVLLLDEATSALDSRSEKSVQDALDQASMGRTTIVVAHRLTTLRNVDFIAVMHSGKIIEYGSHNHLLQNNQGAYFKMVQLQQTLSEDDELSITTDCSEAKIEMEAQATAEGLENPFRSFDQDAKSENYQEDNNSVPSLWCLLQMTAPEWNTIVLSCAVALAFGAIQPFHSFCMGALLSVYFLDDHDEIVQQTERYSFAFLCIGVLVFITNVIQHYTCGVTGEHLTKRVREKMLAKIMTFEVEWFEQESNTSGALCSRLAIEANMIKSLVSDRLLLFAQVLSAATVAVIMGVILAWRLAILIIVLQPLIIGSFYARGVLMKRMSKKVLKAQNKSSSLASEAVGNYRTIAAFSGEEKIMKLFEATLKEPERESQRQSWYAGLGLFTPQFLTSANVGLIFWYGGRLLHHDMITYKHLFQTFFILVTTGRVIAEGGSMTSDLSKGIDAMKSVFVIMKRESKMEPDDSDGIKPEKMKGGIEFNEVFFSYPSRPKQIILQGLSLKVEAGITVALVGQSGSGKSTIISMIERFYDPIKGIVKIDGVDIKSYNLRILRSHIAVVSQEPTLFAGTILENISYGKENTTEAEIIEAATLANAHEFIR
ncbi:hypothetical protein LguiB_024717 [Lonicera macranthoides]